MLSAKRPARLLRTNFHNLGRGPVAPVKPARPPRARVSPAVRAGWLAFVRRFDKAASAHQAANDLERVGAALEDYFGELSRYPTAVQTVLLSLGTCVGLDFGERRPGFVVALAAGDWRSAADECRFPEARARYAVHRAMLLSVGEDT